jgi:hypothetical protein
MITDEMLEAAWSAYIATPRVRSPDSWKAAMRAALEAAEKVRPDRWRPIEEAPKDDSKFMIGRWFYEHEFWDDKKSEWVQTGKREWVQTISHHENPERPHRCRGWNHRNGPMDNPTHYKPIEKGPEE